MCIRDRYNGILTPNFSPICLDHIPVAKTIYSHSIFSPLTTSPSILLFLTKISSTGESSKILAPYALAALASNWVIPDGSPDPSPGINMPPSKSSFLISGTFSLI